MITNDVFLFGAASLVLAVFIFIIIASLKIKSDNNIDPLAISRSYSCGWAGQQKQDWLIGCLELKVV